MGMMIVYSALYLFAVQLTVRKFSLRETAVCFVLYTLAYVMLGFSAFDLRVGSWNELCLNLAQQWGVLS